MYQTLSSIGKNFNAITDNQKFSCTSIPSQNVPNFNNYYSNNTGTLDYVEQNKIINNPRKNVTPIVKKIESDYFGKNISSIKNEQSFNLLPVLDCRYNLREICKQSILLEDHLSQPEKRCMDCCIKHFLALEGLSEEAITLDINNNHQLQLLPSEIRLIQSFWLQNPDLNSHEASQKLRQLRKKYMTTNFDLSKLITCSNGQCKLKN